MQDSVWSYRTTGIGGPKNFGAQQFVMHKGSVAYSPARGRRPTKKFDRQLGKCKQHVKRRQIAKLRR